MVVVRAMCPAESPTPGHQGQAHRMPDIAEEIGSALTRLAANVVPVDTDGVEPVVVRETAGMAQQASRARCAELRKFKLCERAPRWPLKTNPLQHPPNQSHLNQSINRAP